MINDENESSIIDNETDGAMNEINNVIMFMFYYNHVDKVEDKVEDKVHLHIRLT